MKSMHSPIIVRALISPRLISTSSSLRNSSGEKRNAPAGVWSIVGRRTTVAAASASTPKPKRSNSEQPSAKRFGSAAASCQLMAFSEWAGPKAKRQPLWIHPRDGALMLFAGLYESWYPERNQPEVTFTIVTCAANAVIAEIHDRLPVVLDDRAAEDRMNPREQDPLSLKRLLAPARGDLLVMRPASMLVNSVKNDSPTLLDCEEGQQKFAFPT